MEGGVLIFMLGLILGMFSLIGWAAFDMIFGFQTLTDDRAVGIVLAGGFLLPVIVGGMILVEDMRRH